MDRVILGEGCFLEDGIGTFRPNNNQIVVGCSGTGKSMSVMMPTILNMSESSMIATYSKPGEARKIGKYLKNKGYKVDICDLTAPSKSTVSFDPLRYVSDHLDIEGLCAQVVFANSGTGNLKDKYWDDSAICLLSALTEAVLMREPSPTMQDVLNLFDNLTIEEYGKGIRTTLDNMFSQLQRKDPGCAAVTRFYDFKQLPYTTAGCVRDTLAKAVRRMFPESIKPMMRRRTSVDFEALANEKRALLIITSPVNTSLHYFANMIFSTAIKQLLEYAEKCPDQRLPRHVRLMFDDFACAAVINDYSKHIAIFRAAGISTMMLIQSESQLSSLYSAEEATTILNNCSAYVYFPGGMDLTTCRSISMRLDIPVSEVMYAPTGKVIIIRSGEKPVIVPRYDVFNSSEYKDFLGVTGENLSENPSERG